MKKFNSFNFIKAILRFSPRQLEGERKAGFLILKTLGQFNLEYKIQKFKVSIPLPIDFQLLADGKKIYTKPCSFKSGKIEGKENIISSLISSQRFLETPNINFNPKCPGISLANYYFAPALAVSHKELFKILKAKKVSGFVKIKKVSHSAFNILVGNLKNPKRICFAHYDSLEKGATDNAASVAAFLEIIISKPDIIKENLFIFSANEEISFDYPIYWGHGFRVFEKRYLALLKKAEKIIVVDCIGNGKPEMTNKPELLKLGFPIKNLEKFKNKTFLIYGDLEKLESVYHSDLDDINQIKEKYFKMAIQKIIQELK